MPPDDSLDLFPSPGAPPIAPVDPRAPLADRMRPRNLDEVVGQELCIGLIHYLVDNYGPPGRVTDLVDSTEIWILPSMNPDGTALAQRYNAEGIDLNRNFPDHFVDPINTPEGRAVETGLMINWHAGRNVILSANYHGGELVVNYPLDGNEAGTSTFSPAPDPDHPVLHDIALTYSSTNLPMYTLKMVP